MTTANDTPRPRRKPTQKPVPQRMQKVLHPVSFHSLSTRRQDILRFVDRHVRDVGFPPTIREICEAVAISSTSVVNYNIERLIRAGWLERADGASRALRVVQELPGKRTRNDISLDHGVLKITVNLHDRSQTVIEAAQAAIVRLCEVIAQAKGDG